MSAYWDVVCLDCDVGLGLHGNHQDAQAADIARDANKLAAVGELVPDLIVHGDDTYEFSDETSRDARFPVAWFVQHRGHKIRARDEYGLIFNQCREDVQCDRCNHTRPCNLTSGHPGPCDPDAELP